MSGLVWLIIGGALIVAEFFMLDFVLIMIGLACLATAVVAFAGGPLWLQFATVGVSSLLLLRSLRPVIRGRFTSVGRTQGAQALHFRQAMVVEEVSAHAGRVRMDGELWSARTLGSALPAGSSVIVLAVDGVTLEVAPEPNA